MEAAQSGKEHSDILQAGRKATAGTKSRNPAGNSMEVVHFDRILEGWDLDDYFENEDARNWNFLDAGRSGIQIGGSEEGGWVFRVVGMQTCRSVVGFRLCLPWLLDRGFGSLPKLILNFCHGLQKSRGHGRECLYYHYHRWELCGYGQLSPIGSSGCC